MWKLERDRFRLSYGERSFWWREKDTIRKYISKGRSKDVLFNEEFFILLYTLFFAFNRVHCKKCHSGHELTL